tara:strand:+ start:1076 stop:1720 length:645 start_codon:yes stop_codon:yes gene_type:complete
MKDLGNYRKSYEKSELLESSIPKKPIELFHTWFHEAEKQDQLIEVNAMTISTIGSDGFPKSRVVLLKSFNDEGFVFYTNYDSEKGKSILKNPNVCLSFFWPSIERQVIIKGVAEKTNATTSNKYFDSRPEGSKLGAIVSPQSQIIPNRFFLEENLKVLKSSLEGKEITRPENWGGFIIKPISIEFWQGRPNRLHDRIRYYINKKSVWNTERLAP